MHAMSRRLFMGSALAGAALLATPPWVVAATARKKLQGLFPIGFTPVNPTGGIDFEGLASQVQFCRRGRVHGIAWPQIASGWTTLTEAERMQGAEAMLGAAKGGSTAIVIGVQSKTADFSETERYAKHAEKNGADAVICIAPPGVQPGPELVTYYERLGRLTALPLFIQTGGDFSVDLVIELFNKVPTFRYVKDEAGEPLDRVGELLDRSNHQLNVFSGKGVNTLITEMERGFVGHCPFVSYADLYASAWEDYHAGKMREAFDQFGRIEAANTMFPQSDVNILIARGVFKAGTTTRVAPPAPGADMRPHRKPSDPEEIKRELDRYLKPYLKA